MSENDPSTTASGKATTFDVARIAGVSRATVSRAFDENGIINEETRRRVLAIAAQLNYQPHALARGLNRRRSDLVALLAENLRNPLEAELHDLLVSRLGDMKLQPLLVPVGDRSTIEQRLRIAAGYQVSAAMAWADHVTPDMLRAAFGAATPCIMVNGQIGEKVDTIHTDPREGITELVENAHRLHDRFGFIAGRSRSFQSHERKTCLERALQAHGRALSAVREGDFTYRSGYDAALELAGGSQPVDFIMAANDSMAMGAMDAIRYDLRLRVPDDISVVGFDGIEASGWRSYDLTTITATMPVMVRTLLDCLAARRANPDRDAIYHALPTRLIQRTSARIPGHGTALN